jgi:hypothetical protein
MALADLPHLGDTMRVTRPGCVGLPQPSRAGKADLADQARRLAQAPLGAAERLGSRARHVTEDSASTSATWTRAIWIEPETKRLVENLDFPLMFLGEQFTNPYRRTNSAVVSLGRLYAPVAR